MPSLAEWSRPRRPGEPPLLLVGTMNFGKRTPEPAAHRIVHRALDLGLTHFDTANVYVGGEGERILGRALQGRRHQVILSTKVGLHRPGGTASGLMSTGGEVEGLSPERVVAACDESLARLGTDHVDFYYLHVPDPKTPIELTLEGIRRLLDGGKIRAWGTSNYASWQLLEMMTLCDGSGLPRPAMSQQLYNLLVRQLDVEYFHFARRYRHHTAAYNPLAGGLLARPLLPPGDGGAVSPEKGSRFDDNAMYQGRYFTPRLRENVERYAGLAGELGKTLLDLAYGFLASRTGVDSILLGPATVHHLDDAVRAVGEPLPADASSRIDALHRELSGTDATYARL